jgi:hypothetical protein
MPLNAPPESRGEINVKEGERYLFLFDHESRAQILQIFGKFAASEELSFNWHDAAILRQKVNALLEGRDDVLEDE